MRKMDGIERRRRESIQCVEVLIPKTFRATNGHQLFKTLSVYSLHNHPVSGNPSSHLDVFHFMVYDWEKTIRQLLDAKRVHYTVLQFFSPDSIYYDNIVEDLSESVHAVAEMVEG